MNTIQTLNVEGMSCGHCQKAVEGALRQVEGVTNVQVQLESGLATVYGQVDTEELVLAVEEEGYKATPLSTES